MKNSLLAILGASLIGAAPVFAGDAASKGADPQAFVEKAALDGMTEVELGKLAQQKASSAEVKQFGAQMVKDHGKANAELTSLAKPKNLTVPAKLDAKHQQMVDELKSKSGAEFDAAYAEHMQMDHSKAVDLFTAASKGSDPEIAAFARKTLPTLKEHKKMADALPSASSRLSSSK
jgi:putative membrane protein